jgi:hypothetical protein
MDLPFTDSTTRRRDRQGRGDNWGDQVQGAGSVKQQGVGRGGVGKTKNLQSDYRYPNDTAGVTRMVYDDDELVSNRIMHMLQGWGGI